MKKIIFLLLLLLPNIVFSLDFSRDEILTNDALTTASAIDNEHYILSGTRSGEIILSRTYSSEKFSIPAFRGPVTGIDFSTNNNLAVATSLDGSIKAYKFKEKEFLSTFLGHDAPVSQLQIISSTNVVSLDNSSKLLVWNPQNGQEISRGQYHSRSATSMAVIGKYVVIGDRQGELSLYSQKDLSHISTIAVANGNPISNLKVGIDKKTLIVFHRSGPIELYTLEGNQFLKLESLNFTSSTVISTFQLSNKRFWLGLDEEGILSMYDTLKKEVLKTDKIQGLPKWAILDVRENLSVLTRNSRLQIYNLQNFIQQSSTTLDVFKAIDMGDIPELQRLLENGLDPNIRNISRETPLIRLEKTSLSPVVKKELAELLIDFGANILVTDIYGNSYNADVDYKNSLSNDLHKAIIDRDKISLIKTIDSGADVNSIDTFDKPAIRNALEFCNLDIIDILLASSDLKLDSEDLTENLPQSSLPCLTKFQEEVSLRNNGWKILKRGIEENSLELVIDAISKHHLKTNDEMMTSLFEDAVKKSRFEIIRFLIQSGAVVTKKLPLVYFIESVTSLEALEVFLEFGEDINRNRNSCKGLHQKAILTDNYDLLTQLINKHHYLNTLANNSDCQGDNFLITAIKNDASRIYRYMIHDLNISSYQIEKLKAEALLYTLRSKNMKYFKSLIKEIGDLRNTKIQGLPIAFYLRPDSSEAMVNELFNHGVSYSSLSDDGESALTWSARTRNIELFKFFADKVFYQEGENKYSIHYIIDNEDFELLKVYVKYRLHYEIPDFGPYLLKPAKYAAFQNKWSFFQKAMEWYHTIGISFNHPHEPPSRDMFSHDDPDAQFNIADAAGLGGHLELMIQLIKEYKLDIYPNLRFHNSELLPKIQDYLNKEISKRRDIFKMILQHGNNCDADQKISEMDLKNFSYFVEDEETEMKVAELALQKNAVRAFFMATNFNSLDQEKKAQFLEEMFYAIREFKSWYFLHTLISELPKTLPEMEELYLALLLNNAAEAKLESYSKKLFSRITEANFTYEFALSDKAIQYFPTFLWNPGMTKLIPLTIQAKINWKPHADSICDSSLFEDCLSLMTKYGWNVFGENYNPFLRMFYSGNHEKYFPLFIELAKKQNLSLSKLQNSNLLYNEAYRSSKPDSYFHRLKEGGLNPLDSYNRYNRYGTQIRPTHFLKEVVQTSESDFPFLVRLISTVLNYDESLSGVTELPDNIRQLTLMQFLLSRKITPTSAIEALLAKGFTPNLQFVVSRKNSPTGENVSPLLYYILFHSNYSEQPSNYPSSNKAPHEVHDDIILKLAKNISNINQQNSQGHSAVMFMAMWNKKAALTELLKLGANKKLKDKLGRDLADIAKFHGYKDLAKFIKKYK